MNGEFLDISGVYLKKELARVLNAQTFPILEGLAETHIRVLNLNSTMVHIAKDVEFIREGDSPSGLYFITDGEFAVAKRVGSQNKPIIITKLHRGEVFGEYTVMHGKSRIASVIAMRPSTVVHVEERAVKQVIEADAAFCKRLWKLMKQRLVHTFLLTHPLFINLSEDTRRVFTSKMQSLSFSAGETVFRQGETATLYMVISGEIELERSASQGGTVVIDIRRDGDFVGELGFVTGKPQPYTAIAKCNSDLFALNKQGIASLANLQADVYSAFVKEIKSCAIATLAKIKEGT